MSTNPPPAEEAIYYVCPTSERTNDHIRRSYGAQARNYFVQNVKCSDGPRRSLWKVSLEFLAELSKVTPTLGMIVYKKPIRRGETDKPAAPIALAYLLQSRRLPV